MPFSFCIFSGKLCCIEAAAGHLLEESFHGTQTSTQTPFFVSREGKYAPPGKISVNQQRLWFLIERLKKWPSANNVCTSVLLVTNENHHTVECFCISSIKVSVLRLSKAVWPPDHFFWLLVYLFLLKVEVCMSETCSCTKGIFCKDKFLVVWKEETGANSPTGRLFVSFSLFFFQVGPHVLSHSTDEEASPEATKAKVMIVHNAACLWERMRDCVLERICNFFLFFLNSDCFIFKNAPSFQMIFLKTHNANQLKCCCNGLTCIPPSPRINPAASIVVQFPPCFQMFLLFCPFFFLWSDETRSVGLRC